MAVEKTNLSASTGGETEYAPPPGYVVPRPQYLKLRRVLDLAYAQAAVGKGKVRHSNVQSIELDFESQPICTLTRMYGLGFPVGQAAKKAHEAVEIAGDHGMQELLGAINYLAAAYLVLEERTARGMPFRASDPHA
jgi:hypothetical protein